MSANDQALELLGNNLRAARKTYFPMDDLRAFALRIETYKQGHYPAPKWQLEPGGLWVVFEFPGEHVRQPADKTGQATGQAETWVLKVLQACANAELTRSQIQEITGIKHRETFQNNYLNPLLADGLIERTIPDKPTSPKQRYRITSLGLLQIKQ